MPAWLLASVVMAQDLTGHAWHVALAVLLHIYIVLVSAYILSLVLQAVC